MAILAARPPTNRGVQITTGTTAAPLLEFVIHELTGTTTAELTHVIEALSAFGIVLEEQKHGTRLYRRRWLGAHGVTLQAENKVGSPELHLRIPGEACDYLGRVDLLALATLIWLKPTRLDAAVDYCPFLPEHLLEAYRHGLARTHSQTMGWHSSPDGDTFTLGSRSSDISMRCYNRRGYTRTELEMRRGHAERFLASLYAATDAEVPALFLGAVRGLVDFVDTRADTNKTRCPLLPFWADFVGMFEKLRLAPARTVATAKRYRQQARKQMASMFYTYVASSVQDLGMNWQQVVGELYSFGSKQAKTRHRMVLGHGVVTV